MLENHTGLSAKKSGGNARYYRRILFDITGTFWGKNRLSGGGGVIAQKSGVIARYYMCVLLDITGTFSGKIDLVVTTVSKSRT